MLLNRINEKPYWQNDAYVFPTNYEKMEWNDLPDLYRESYTIPLYWKIIYNEIICGARVTYSVSAKDSNKMELILEVRQDASVNLINSYLESVQEESSDFIKSYLKFFPEESYVSNYIDLYYRELTKEQNTFNKEVKEQYPWTQYRYFTIHSINNIESIHQLRKLFNTVKQNRLTMSHNKRWFKLEFFELHQS